MKIQLVDYNEEMCREWHKYFDDCNDVFIHEGDFFSVPTDCYVSPANSFGFLDGGIDNKIRKVYGKRNILLVLMSRILSVDLKIGVLTKLKLKNDENI